MAIDTPETLIDELERSLNWLARAGWKGFDCAPQTLARLDAWSRPLVPSARWSTAQSNGDGGAGAAPALDRAECEIKDRLLAADTAGAAPAANPDESETPDQIRKDLGDCRRCKLCRQRQNIVFGQGDPRARLVFVGEGPGHEEDLAGEPFVGAAGHLLTKIIQAMGLFRHQVYICNIIKCRPPGNRNPEPDEIAACIPFLQRQLTAIAPACICALGAVAARALLETDLPIGKLRGRFHQYRGIPVMPTFHPAYLLRNPEQKRAVWQDVQQIMARLGLSPPRGDKSG